MPEPVADLIERWLLPTLEGRAGTTVVGLCGPQGSGKSTVSAELKRRLDAAGLPTAILSLDDLYLPRAEREQLACAVHPLLRTRGPPGTHDVGLGLAVLDALARPEPARIPRFDKATDDRAPPSAWEPYSGPAAVVLFEGWCVGARPQRPDALVEPANALERAEDPHGLWRRYVNDALAGSYQALFARVDRLALLRAPDFATVVRWRQQQEHALRERLARGEGQGSAMTDPEVARFVQHYERLTRSIADEMPARADLVIQLDADRRGRSIGVT